MSNEPNDNEILQESLDSKADTSSLEMVHCPEQSDGATKDADAEASNEENLCPPEQSEPKDEAESKEPAEEEAAPERKSKRRKKEPLTKEQRRKKTVKGLVITAIVLSCIIVLFGVFAVVNVVGVKGLTDQSKAFAEVDYGGAQLVPTKDADGWWTFTADRDLKVMQLTDVHIGAGFMSQQKDSWALNAVATMITQEKPDLVIVTGDIAYPVPFQAGTFNNLNATKIFATMMEKLGVYWTFAFGNHDTEVYSMYSRQVICDWYAEQNFKYCLFQANTVEEDKEGFGYGNNVIKVKNSAGIVTQALVLFDSHSYTDGDYMGALWKYDNIHQNQIDWYVAEIDKINTANRAIDTAAPLVPSLAFFHIPLREYRRAWATVRTWAEETKGNIDFLSDYANAYPTEPYAINEDIKFFYGIMGESDKTKNGERTWGVYCGVPDESLYPVVDGVEQDGVFFTTGKSIGLRGIFCGHDHYNNFSIEYKGVKLTYGMSIDYLAYAGIWKEKAQRGCTIITLKPDGRFTNEPRNYYEDYTVTQKH